MDNTHPLPPDVDRKAILQQLIQNIKAPFTLTVALWIFDCKTSFKNLQVR